jgi:hypothetical protein
MSFDARRNFAISSIAVAPTPAGSGLVLSLLAGGGALMPEPPFNATCWPPGVNPTAANAEIVRVASIEGDTVTLSKRGEEDTAALQIAEGWWFAQTITAGDIGQLQAAIEGKTSGGYIPEEISGPTSLEYGKAYFANTAGGPFTCQAPVAAGNAGRTFVLSAITPESANAITLKAVDGETISNEPEVLVAAVGEYDQSITVISDGTNLRII